MELLFKRQQTGGVVGRVKFKLWTQVALDEDEQEIINRYRFDRALLIAETQPNLIRTCLFIAVGVSALLIGILMNSIAAPAAIFISVIVGGGVAYIYFTEKRETIYVEDLIHGHYFSCRSVVDLAKKEAWLKVVSSFLRQVMESAKHWDGTESHIIEALPKDEARQVLIRGL